MTCVTYKEHQMYSLNERPKVFVLRTQELERLDVRTYAFMLDSDPTLWEQFDTRKLGEICHTFLGSTPKDAGADESNGVAFIKTKNVYTNYLDLSDVGYITEQAHKTRRSSALKDGDILMTIIGASFEVIGRCLVYRGQPDPANINQNVIGIRVKDGIDLDPDFLCLQLNTQYGQMQVGQKAQRTAQFSLNKGLVEDFDIIASQDDRDQKLIVERFNHINAVCQDIKDQSIQLIKQKIETIGRSLDAVLVQGSNFGGTSKKWDWILSQDPKSRAHAKNRQAAIIDVQTMDDRIDTRYYLPSRLRERVKREPEKWGVLSDYSEISRESYSSNGQLRHVAIDQMPNDPWVPFETQNEYEGPATYLEKGDIAFSRLLPTIMNGKCFLAWDKLTGSPEFIRIKTKETYQRALLFWLKSNYVREYLIANVRGSSASQKRFTEDDIAACPVPKSLVESPDLYIEPCERALSLSNDLEVKSQHLASLSEELLGKVKNNIFKLLDSRYFENLKKSVKEIQT